MDELTLADETNTDEIIGAIRRIMATDEEVLTDEEGTGRFSKEARERIFTALDRLTGSEKSRPLYSRRWCLNGWIRFCKTGSTAIYRPWLNA